MPQTVEIRLKDYALCARPEIGGSIARLTWRDVDLLRPTPEGATDPLQTSCFPLAPFANRIAHGAFMFGGRAIELALNIADHPHALHGHAWQRPWRLEEASRERIRMRFEYAPGDWPWAYRAEQIFELGDNGARLTLSLQNCGQSPMPASIGFHPYFLRPPGAVLRGDVSGMWRIDDTILPTEFDRHPILALEQGALLDDAPFVDHCFTGWRRSATLTQDPTHSVSITAGPEFPFLHIYLPTGQNYLCIEPVSAMPDAVNHADDPASGLRVLAAGETLSGGMRIEALPTTG
jgi:aldose 1-epimerase